MCGLASQVAFGAYGPAREHLGGHDAELRVVGGADAAAFGIGLHEGDGGADAFGEQRRERFPGPQEVDGVVRAQDGRAGDAFGGGEHHGADDGLQKVLGRRLPGMS